MKVDDKYLIGHGFELYLECGDNAPYSVPFYNKEDKYYVEKEFNRNMFVIILFEEGGHAIYVQEDAGCGFTQIPERWAELDVEHFEAIYFGIRGNKPAIV